MSICNLEKIDVIFGMLWQATHNPETNQRMEEFKLSRCLLLCGKNPKIIKKSEKERKVIIEDERNMR